MPRRQLKDKIHRRGRPKGALSARTEKRVRKIAKQVAMKIPEKKVFGFADENQQLIHNKPIYLAKWLGCSQGTADPSNLSARLVRGGAKGNFFHFLW